MLKELPTHHLQDDQTPMEQNFVVDNMIDEENSSGNDDDSQTNLQFDPVCSICDNGGYVLWYVKLHKLMLFLELFTNCNDFI